MWPNLARVIDLPECMGRREREHNFDEMSPNVTCATWSDEERQHTREYLGKL